MALGCGGGSATAPLPATATSSAEVDDEATLDLKEHHRHHHHGGVPMFIAMSLHSLDVNPEQKAQVEKIQADLFAKIEPSRAADNAVMTLLADGAAAGQIDEAKVDAALDQLRAAASGLHDASADALNQLHAVLTPPQRAALVDKVEAHWAVWKETNEGGEGGKKPNHERIEHISKELSLSADQTDKIKASLSAGKLSGPVAKVDPAVIESHIQAFAAAFKSDQFDSKALTQGGPANGNMAAWGATRMAHFVEAVVPTLTPEQRTKFAAHLREHANHSEHDG
jgi:Spy/CpxP family protein refolding chaperone